MYSSQIPIAEREIENIEQNDKLTQYWDDFVNVLSTADIPNSHDTIQLDVALIINTINSIASTGEPSA